MFDFKITGKTLVAGGLVSAALFATGLATSPAFADEGSEFKVKDDTAVSSLVQSKADDVQASGGLLTSTDKVISTSGLMFKEPIEQKVRASHWREGMTLVTAICAGEPGHVVTVKSDGETSEVWRPAPMVEDIPLPNFKNEVESAVGAKVQSGGWPNSVLVSLPFDSAESWLPKIHGVLPKCAVGEKFDGSTAVQADESGSEEASKPTETMTQEERDALPIWGE
ncbi:MAG: hypothetical protein ACTIMF_06730 [Gordonia sp. (in: high G+C Gram-positive bacteria)]